MYSVLSSAAATTRVVSIVQTVCGERGWCSECPGLGGPPGLELPTGPASLLLHTKLQGLTRSLIEPITNLKRPTHTHALYRR